MRIMSKRVLVAASVALLVAVGSASAVDVDWGNASGSNARFVWSQGQSGDGDLGGGGLWGDPTVTEQGFFFTDMDPTFEAEATYPGTDAVLSATSVTLNAVGGRVTEIHVREGGTFTGDVADVEASVGSLSILFMNPPASVINVGPLDYEFNVAEGTWTASLDVDVLSLHPMLASANGALLFNVDVTNHLKAEPDTIGATSASIQKTYASIVIPEPSSLLLGAIGLFSLVNRRSRS